MGLSSETKELMNQCDVFRKKAAANREGPDWEYYKFLRNKVVHNREADKNLLKNTAKTKDTSAMYHGLSKILGWNRQGATQSLTVNGSLLNKPVEIATAMNEYFIN